MVEIGSIDRTWKLDPCGCPQVLTGTWRQGLSFGFHCSLLSYPSVCRLAGDGFLLSDLCSLPFVVLFALVSICCPPRD